MGDIIELRPADPRIPKGHGSRACYVNGCKRPECMAAHAAYMRE
jgi:hypothetical protein